MNSMTKCAGCRVRHLNCDTQPTCTECEKSGRECVRLNVRFRYLVCPFETFTAADYSKYEFFFDANQTWVDTNTHLEFVAGENDCADPIRTSEISDTDFAAVEVTAASLSGPVWQSSPTIVSRATSHSPILQVSTLNDDTPGLMAVTEKLPRRAHEISGNYSLYIEPTMEDHPTRTLSPPSHEALSDDLMTVPSTRDCAWPLQDLEECKLFQHFITHLAPWVSMCTFLVLIALAESKSSLTLAIAEGTSARLPLQWQRQALY